MFWKNFVYLCNENKKSPNGVCMELGLSTATATKWKNGSLPRHTTLQKIANYFNVSVEYLCGKEEKPTGENAGELTDQEKILLNTFRSSSEEAKQRIIQSVLNIHDEYEKKNQAADSANAS